MGAAVTMQVTEINLLSEATDEPLMVTEPMYVPGVMRGRAFTAMSQGAGEGTMLPEPVINCSQFPPEPVLTDAFRPVPSVKTGTVLVAAEPPNGVRYTVIEFGTPVVFTVTLMTCGASTAPGDVTVRYSVYMPPARADVLRAIEIG